MSNENLPSGAIGRGEKPQVRGNKNRSFPSIHWIRDLFIAVALALAIITFVYQPVKVEGTSMTPKLADQERIFINKFIYSFSSIARGDIVVFRFPRDPRKSFIKRVVAVPGEAVEIVEGVVTVNGQPLPEDYLRPGDRDLSSFPRLRLPPGHYFVLGDRRRSSNDSRTWGTVHRDYIYGKAVFSYWPLKRFGPIETTNGEE